MIISIFASIWSQNLWDELILKNEIKFLENEYGSNTQFYVFSYDYKNPFFSQNNIKYIEYFPIWIRKKSNILKNIYNFFKFINIILKSNLVVIWWGGIIYDIEKQINKNPLDQWIFRTNIFRFFSKKFNFFAVWINIKNDENLIQINKIFYKANSISVRDKYSLNLLKNLWIKSKLVMDPVFDDNDQMINKNKTLIHKIESNKFTYNNLENFDFNWKIVWISFRSWYLSNNWSKLSARMEEWKINEIINYVLWSGWKVILMPHSFHKTDIFANDYLFLKNFLRDNENISICKSMSETYNIYISKKIDICLSMRLHSIILSQVYEIPFIWISYSIKTDEILNYIENNYEK